MVGEVSRELIFQMICQQQLGVPQGTGLQTRVGQEGWQPPEDWQEEATYTMGLQLTGRHTAGLQITGMEQDAWQELGTQQDTWQELGT